MAQTKPKEEDPGMDFVDVLEYYRGLPIVTLGDDGFTEVFDDTGCDILDDDESVNMLQHPS